MAITGISAISGEQIIAAGAVSAKEAGKASFTTGGNNIQSLYDTVSTNSASWSGGGATLPVSGSIGDNSAVYGLYDMKIEYNEPSVGGSEPYHSYVQADTETLTLYYSPDEDQTYNLTVINPGWVHLEDPVDGSVEFYPADVNNWKSVYDTVSTESGNWTGGGASYTGDAQGALDEVYSKSANWNTAYGTLANKSAFWDDSYYSILLNSAAWARDYTGGKNITVSGNGLHATVSTTDNISVTGDVAISNNSETYLGSNLSESWGGCETPINSITDHYRLEFKNLSPTTGLSISVEDAEDWEQSYKVSNLTTADLQDFAITSLSSVAGATVSTAGTWTDLNTLLANGKVNVISTDNSYYCSAWRIDSTNVSLSGLNNFIETNSASWTASGPSYTAGNCISLTGDIVAWNTSAGITDIVSATALPQNPVSTIIYLIPE